MLKTGNFLSVLYFVSFKNHFCSQLNKNVIIVNLVNLKWTDMP